MFDTYPETKIIGLTIENGRAGPWPAYGGGVRNWGELTLTDVTLRGNESDGGGGLWNNASGSAALRRVVITRNTAPRGGEGGAIFNFGQLSVSDSSLTDNEAATDGGGIYSNTFYGPVTLDRVTIAANRAANGGGILNHGPLAILNSTISGNSAAWSGGGVLNAVSHSQAVTITNVTLSGDSAARGAGDEIYELGTTSRLDLKNTIIAGRSLARNCGGEMIKSLGHNLDSGSSCRLDRAGDHSDIEPLIGALSDNGGLTKTRALLIGSPAIDAADADGCPAVDQRGRPRPQDGDRDGTVGCDIGAFESEQLNSAPVVRDDAYQITEGAVLAKSAAEGILANDSDPDGDPITVASPWPLSGPSHGALTLRADGSFSYTPTAGYVGIDSFAYRATDGHEASRTATATIRITYPFSGFFPPVSNRPGLNVAKAGSAIPVKFSLSGYRGLSVIVPEYPKSKPTDCDSGELAEGIDQTEAAGSSGLAYDASEDQYIYVWKTHKAWAKGCRSFVIKLRDGTYQGADFKFTRYQ